MKSMIPPTVSFFIRRFELMIDRTDTTIRLESPVTTNSVNAEDIKVESELNRDSQKGSEKMTSEPFAFHNLPDDIVRCVLEEWLYCPNMSFLEDLRAIDLAYCDRKLRRPILNSMAGISVSVNESCVGIDLNLLYSWIYARNLKIVQFHMDLTEDSARRGLPYDQRIPFSDLLCNLETAIIDVDFAEDLGHSMIKRVFRGASDLKNVALVMDNVDDFDGPSEEMTEEAMEILSRVTSLTTATPDVMVLKARMAPSLRKLTLSGASTFETFCRIQVVRPTMFSLLEELSVSYMEDFMDDLDQLLGPPETMKAAELPNLTKLSLMIYGECSSVVYQYLTRGAPGLTHLEIGDFTSSSREFCQAIFFNPPPNLLSLSLDCELFVVDAEATAPFPVLRADLFSEMDDPMEELCLNAVHFVAQASTVSVTMLKLSYVSFDLISKLPWQTLSNGQLKSLTLACGDFLFAPSTWNHMILAPTSHLALSLQLSRSKKSPDVDMMCLATQELCRSERTSFVTNLSWYVVIGDPDQDEHDHAAERLADASLMILLSVFPNVVHCKCTLPELNDKGFVSLVENWRRLRRMHVHQSYELTLTSESWSMLLSQTQCREFAFYSCPGLFLNAVLKFALKLQSNGALTNWTVSMTDSQQEFAYYVKPTNHTTTKKRRVVLTTKCLPTGKTSRAYPVVEGEFVVLEDCC